jgi:hypothetical protein
VWHIAEDRSNLRQVVTAVATGLDSISNFDYILLDERFFDEAGIEVKHTNGETADATVSKKYHRDLRNLTATQVRKLAEEILKRSEESLDQSTKRMGRIQEKIIKTWAKEAIKEGQLDFDAIRVKSKDQLL